MEKEPIRPHAPMRPAGLMSSCMASYAFRSLTHLLYVLMVVTASPLPDCAHYHCAHCHSATYTSSAPLRPRCCHPPHTRTCRHTNTHTHTRPDLITLLRSSRSTPSARPPPRAPSPPPPFQLPCPAPTAPPAAAFPAGPPAVPTAGAVAAAAPAAVPGLPCPSPASPPPPPAAAAASSSSSSGSGTPPSISRKGS